MKLDLEFTAGMAVLANDVLAAIEQAGAYALITDAEGRVLIVRADNGRFYLPGGRIERGETPQRALAREIEEECGWSARIGAAVCAAFQPILGGAVNLRASYWRVELIDLLQEESEHLMLWTPRVEAASRLHRAADVSAVLSF